MKKAGPLEPVAIGQPAHAPDSVPCIRRRVFPQHPCIVAFVDANMSAGLFLAGGPCMRATGGGPGVLLRDPEDVRKKFAAGTISHVRGAKKFSGSDCASAGGFAISRCESASYRIWHGDCSGIRRTTTTYHTLLAILQILDCFFFAPFQTRRFPRRLGGDRRCPCLVASLHPAVAPGHPY